MLLDVLRSVRFDIRECDSTFSCAAAPRNNCLTHKIPQVGMDQLRAPVYLPAQSKVNFWAGAQCSNILFSQVLLVSKKNHKPLQAAPALNSPAGFHCSFGAQLWDYNPALPPPFWWLNTLLILNSACNLIKCILCGYK